MDTAKYQIEVHSCKKDTVVTMYLTPAEAQLLARLAKLTQDESKSECQPTVRIALVKKITVNGAEE